MSFWVGFWTIIFFVSLVIFAGLAIVVTVGGFFDIRSLFKTLNTEHEQAEKDTEN